MKKCRMKIAVAISSKTVQFAPIVERQRSKVEAQSVASFVSFHRDNTGYTGN